MCFLQCSQGRSRRLYPFHLPHRQSEIPLLLDPRLLVNHSPRAIGWSETKEGGEREKGREDKTGGGGGEEGGRGGGGGGGVGGGWRTRRWDV